MREERLLELAKLIMLYEQDIASRERDVVKRRKDLQVEEHKLTSDKEQLEKVRRSFSAAARGEVLAIGESTIFTTVETIKTRRLSTIQERILVVLEKEPKALSATEVFDALEPSVNKTAKHVVQTALSKLYYRGLVARPFYGHYCALEYEEEVKKALGMKA
jgi:hypothetical protein